MKLVAEGVESLDQVECLTDMGVEFLQGFYFSKPLPASDIGQSYLDPREIVKSSKAIEVRSEIN